MDQKQIFDRIYVSIVTYQGDWRKMLTEVDKYKLKQISLFLTCADAEERKDIFVALEKSVVKTIPHVHARHDFREEEFDYLVKRFKTRLFTIHYQHLKYFENSKHLKKFFIETNNGPHGIKSIRPFQKVGGLCIDLSHISYFKDAAPKDYNLALRIAKEYKVGCNHISAYRPHTNESLHRVLNIKELDYLQEIDKRLFSNYLCIELGNPIKQQLEFKKYIAKLLYKSWNKKS